MPKTKRSNPQFKKGGTVYVITMGRNCEITDCFWNNFTWMYSFKDEAMSCGEMYLATPKESEVV